MFEIEQALQRNNSDDSHEVTQSCFGGVTKLAVESSEAPPCAMSLSVSYSPAKDQPTENEAYKSESGRFKKN